MPKWEILLEREIIHACSTRTVTLIRTKEWA